MTKDKIQIKKYIYERSKKDSQSVFSCHCDIFTPTSYQVENLVLIKVLCVIFNYTLNDNFDKESTARERLMSASVSREAMFLFVR